MRTVKLLTFVTVALLASSASATRWPIPPLDSVHPLGNNWGEFQDYGGSPYYHNGIDIITPGQQGAEVHAVRHGWVKGWGTISAEYHYRLAICDTNSGFTGRASGWLYAHIDASRTHKNLGDEVQEGELIGYLVPWPVTGFDHIHFARISDTGATWMRFPNVTWWFTQNPLTIIQPNRDLLPPVFQNARSGARFAFCRDNVNNNYLTPTNLTGDIDIIARIYDKTGYTTTDTVWDKLVPYQVDYMIRSTGGTVVVPWTIGFQFSNLLDGTLWNVTYKDDNTCRTYGDYDSRDYYFIVTNTDGDTIIEASDTQGKWATATVNDGDYWVITRAKDVFNNTTTDSMQVHTNNGVAVVEHALPVLSRAFAVSPEVSRGPFTVNFSLGSRTRGRVRVVDPAGRVVAQPVDGMLNAGEHSYRCEVRATGVYLVELTLANGDTYTRKLVVMQ